VLANGLAAVVSAICAAGVHPDDVVMRSNCSEKVASTHFALAAFVIQYIVGLKIRWRNLVQRCSATGENAGRKRRIVHLVRRRRSDCHNLW
jgi:hypothetical protein